MTPVRFLISVPAVGKLSVGVPADFRFQRVSAPSLATRHRAAIWIADDRDLLQHTNTAVVLGRVFDRSRHRRLASLPGETAEIASPSENIRNLSAHVWGAWFALHTDQATSQMFIARDPSSHLPVYRQDHGNHILFASEVALLADAAGLHPEVSWHQLSDYLRYPELRQAETCLAGISEVEPGALTPLSGDGTARVALWDPWVYAQAKQKTSMADTASVLRETTIACVGAWAADSGRVAVAASGGLDSSIICAALAAIKHPFDCITIATADPSGDESAYVRPLAAALGVRLVCQTFQPDGIDLTCAASAHLPRPVRKGFMLELQRAMRQGVDDLGADVVFDGNGGDNLFCYLHSAAPIVDRLWEEGPSAGLLHTFLDMCRMTESDVPTMARAFLRRLSKNAASAWIPDNRLLADHVTSSAMPLALTPWALQARRNPGKAMHIGLLQRAQNFTHDLVGSSALLQFSPLMSQPLLELCLSVPTWQWCDGGINRSLARAAFHADLPAATLRRTAKAGPDSFLRVIVRQNRQLIGEMLRNGLLAHHRLLDMRSVEQALMIDEQADDPIINRLLDLVEAEAWARSWSR